MHQLLWQFVDGIQLTGDMRADMQTFLLHHNCPQTVEHCMRVGVEAKRLAARFGVDESSAEIAGWLHDISVVFPNRQRPQIARQLGVRVLPEEDKVPMIIHQKLSVVVAREIFGVTDEAILSAIGCHTTLKANASALDKVVFVADKIQWDQAGKPPYLAGLLSAVEQSLDQAALYFLDYWWQRRGTLPVIHPWFVAAYRQLSDGYKE